MHFLSRLINVSILTSALSATAQEAAISIKTGQDRAEVSIGGQPFTELLFGADRAKPVLYPIFGPHQIRMTRDFPFKDTTPGEKHDHPHHESLWYTHGDVNGVSFWELSKQAGTIKQTELKVDGDTIETKDDWLAPGGKRVCRDRRAMKFSSLPGGARMIDFTITIEASDGDLTFGDTKEGSMGIRTHPLLRTDKGAEVTNSEGQKGKAIWGKPARWVNYQSKIDGKQVGVAIFDSPKNPRHPSTWHAREYGLVAANPFGAHDFSGAAKGTGDLKIKSGESVTFRYAFLFHNGSDEKESVDAHYEAWAKQP